MKKILILVPAIIVVLLVVGYVIANRSQGSDSDQIRGLMERGQQAIETKQTRMASSCISKDYSDDLDMNREKICKLAAQAFTARCDYEVVLSNPEIVVNGDVAEATSHLTLSSVTESDRVQQISSVIILHFKREPSKRFLIYPVSVWKVTKIDGIGKIQDFGI